MIEKRGMGEKGQQLYSIRNVGDVGDGRRMNYEDGGNVYCPTKGYEMYEQWVK